MKAIFSEQITIAAARIYAAYGPDLAAFFRDAEKGTVRPLPAGYKDPAPKRKGASR